MDEAETVQLASGYELVHLSPLPSTSIIYVVNDVSGFGTSSTLQQILNAYGSDQSRLQNTLTDTEVHDMFDNRGEIS